MIYAGIGSRNTPIRILKLMEQVGSYLAKRGYTLRSGGAVGADSAFEIGCDAVGGAKEIYKPDKVDQAAMDLAARFHPRFEDLGPFAQLLIARDGYQVLGQDLTTPCRFVMCWTPGAKIVGGTGQALRIALHHKIPIINLADPAQETLTLQKMILNIDFLQDTMYSLFE